MAVPQPDSDFHRRSVHALEQHNCASLARRASLADPRANHRYHPWASAQVQQQRPSAPDILNTSQYRLDYAQPSPVHDFPVQQPSPATTAAPFEGWHNDDPFGTSATNTNVAAAHDNHHLHLNLADHNHFSVGPTEGIVPVSLSSYEFPPKHDHRQSIGSVSSVQFSDGSVSTTGTGGHYFSDIPSSEDGDGRRGSCVSASDMFNGLSVGDDYRSRGSNFTESDTGTISYPSPPSDRGRSASVPTIPNVPPVPSPMERSVSYSMGHDALASMTMPPPPTTMTTAAVEFHVRHPGTSPTHTSNPDGMQRSAYKYPGPGEYASPYGYGHGYAPQQQPQQHQQQQSFGEQAAYETHRPLEFDAGGGLQRFQ